MTARPSLSPSLPLSLSLALEQNVANVGRLQDSFSLSAHLGIGRVFPNRDDTFTLKGQWIVKPLTSLTSYLNSSAASIASVPMENGRAAVPGHVQRRSIVLRPPRLRRMQQRH